MKLKKRLRFHLVILFQIQSFLLQISYVYCEYKYFHIYLQHTILMFLLSQFGPPFFKYERNKSVLPPWGGDPINYKKGLEVWCGLLKGGWGWYFFGLIYYNNYNNYDNQQDNVSKNMGEIKTITFRFNVSIFTSFRRSPPPLSSTHQY